MKAFQASILFSAALIALSACHNAQYRISGTTEGLKDGDTLFITNNLETGEPTDTIILKDGKFSLEGETDSTILCMIYSASRNELNAPFFVEPGNISIAIKQQPGTSRVGGTKCNDEWQRLNDSVMVIGREINRIAEHIYGGTTTEQEQRKGMEQIDRLNQRFAALVVRTAEQNVNNEFGFFLLTYYPEELIDNATRSRLIEQLPAAMKQRPAIRQMTESIRHAAKTAEGQTMGNFTQQTLDGKQLSLTDEIGKNKLTVIDFWASWCGPCRQEMPFMIEMYNRLKDQGLGIIGISLDNDHAAWTSSSRQMNIPWPQMSDLKGWDNAIAKECNVTSIPHTIIVDQQGRILRRGLRGEKLEQFLTEELKK